MKFVFQVQRICLDEFPKLLCIWEERNKVGGKDTVADVAQVPSVITGTQVTEDVMTILLQINKSGINRMPHYIKSISLV